ncbi:MAG: PPC domain-containing protein [Myxococcales bacterium]|nr:PPC domain-containing protein [Myxococcales bacterium]
MRTIGRTSWKRRAMLLITAGLLALAGCGAPGSQDTLPTQRPDENGKSDASALATFLTFEFDASFFVSSSWGTKQQIENQLLYTIGQLNGENSVGRLDHVELSTIESNPTEGGYLVSYHAKMLVAWGNKNDIPERYELLLPRDMTYDGLETFTERYKHDCVDWGAHDVDPNSMWYYYRPKSSSCRLQEGDTISAVATVRPSEVTTTGRYPEYHKIWEDGVFRSVVIFGKYEDGATSNSDPGIAAFNGFVASVKTRLSAYELTTVPESLTTTPGVANPDVTISATLPDGKKVEVVVLLIDGVRSAPPSFDTRYASISGKADFIAYNGHSGLGANIRALAQKGKWETGQYSVIFMNGCDTYAYVDSALYDARVAVNPDDTKGTKYLDLVMNAMPAPSREAGNNTLAIFEGLLAYDAPKTYEQIFKGIGSSQVVLVSGEEDNVYHPGFDGTPSDPEPWNGLDESGSILKDAEQRFVTPTLKPGTYLFQLSGSGDADLYLRIGDDPSTSLYDCRPYRYGTDEACKVTINSAAKLHLMVRGWDDSSDFRLVGTRAE